MQGDGLPKKICLFRKGTQYSHMFFFAFELKCSIFLRRGSIVPQWGQIFLSKLSHNGAQHSSEEAPLSHNGAQYSSGEAQLSKFSSYEVCVLRNCGESVSAQVVYEGKIVRVAYHASRNYDGFDPFQL